MDRNYIERHLVVDRYVKGTLADTELAEFEERLVWDETLIEEVQLAEKLIEGLKGVQLAGELPASSGLFSRLAGYLATPQLAAAASFVLGIGVASVLLFPATPPTGGGTTTTIVALDVLRGSGGPTIDVDGAAWTVLLVETPPGDAAYRVTIVADGSGTDAVWQQSGLRPAFADSLSIGLPGRLLVDGQHLLSVERSAGDADNYTKIQDIPFVVRRID